MAVTAAALHPLVSLGNQKSTTLSGLSLSNVYSVRAGGASSSVQRCAVASGSVAFVSKSSLQERMLMNFYWKIGTRRFPRIIPFVSRSKDSKHSDINVSGLNDNKTEVGQNESEKAWKQVLDSFKQQGLRMQSLSQEAYEIYSRKALVVLEETSRNMKIQAVKASRDIAAIVKEISLEGREYIYDATKNSPEPVKEIVEVFSAPPGEVSDISKVHDFHLGIPYGVLLALGGFTSFMFTGSTSAIRFGVILGSVLLALSVSSLRTWKKGKTSPLLLKGQAAIASIIFWRECRLLFQKASLPASAITTISGAMLAFYLYRILLFRQGHGQNLEKASEDQSTGNVSYRISFFNYSSNIRQK